MGHFLQFLLPQFLPVVGNVKPAAQGEQLLLTLYGKVLGRPMLSGWPWQLMGRK
jgi:hypothetical protein